MKTSKGISRGISSLPLLPLLIAFTTPTCCTSVLVRSEDSGGLATGLAYNLLDDQVVIVGTTFEKSFWGLGLPIEKGECFMALGDVTHNNPEFTRMALPTPAVCFGGTSTLPHNDEGGIGTATILGMSLEGNDLGFIHSVLYYLGQLAMGPNPPTSLPSKLLPVTSTQGFGDAPTLFVGLHPVDTTTTPFDSSSSSPSTNRLQSLLEYWWHSTIPSQEGLVTAAPANLARGAPHVRKHEIYTGRLFFDVSLETTDDSTALIAGMVETSFANTASNFTQTSPLIVVGSTNGADVSNSLFGQTSNPKSSNQTDWDGYILFLDPNTGAVFEELMGGSDLATIVQRKAIRINSIGDGDDFINGVCVSPDQRYLYVVGSTQGIIQGIHKGGAFVIQYDMETWEMTWQYQQTGNETQGLACTADYDAVYIGGSTETDLLATAQSVPTATPDGFVTKITNNGQEAWTELLDTTIQENGDKRREVIVGMEVTAKGQILVLMNSMNLETGKNDVFLLDLDSSTGESDLDAALKDLARTSTFATRGADKTRNEEVLVIAIVVPVAIALLLFAVTYWRHRTDVERIPKATLQEHSESQDKQEAESVTEQETVGASVV